MARTRIKGGMMDLLWILFICAVAAIGGLGVMDIIERWLWRR